MRRVDQHHALPVPDIISNAGSQNPMDRETRYAGCTAKTCSDKGETVEK